MSVLQETRAGFEICGPLQELFRRTAVECDVSIPSVLDQMMEPRSSYDMDDILDSCTRLSYTQPLDQILHHIDTSIVDEWEFQWNELIDLAEGDDRNGSNRDRYMHIDSLLNR